MVHFSGADLRNLRHVLRVSASPRFFVLSYPKQYSRPS